MDFYISVLQAFLFYLVPTLIGRPIVQRILRGTLFYPFITYFITGGFVVFLTALILEYGVRTLVPSVSFAPLFSGIVAALTLVSLPFNFIHRDDLQLKKLGVPVLASVLATIPFSALWIKNSPYSFNWDMLEHQTLVNNILGGRFSFMTSQVSDTFGFDGYSSFIHTLMASSQIYFPTDMLVYWQTIGFIHFALVILSSYLITKEVTENKALSYIALILAAGVFDSYISFTSLFFIPQTFTAVVSILLLAQLFKQIKNNQIPSALFIGISALFVLLNHYIIGVGAIGLYLMVYLYSKFREAIAQRFNRMWLVAGIGTMAIIASALSGYVPLDSLNSGEAAAFTPTWSEKLRIMRQAYGWLLALIFPIGIATILRWRGEVEALVLTITFILLAVVLMQFPYVMKFYVLARFFVHIILAIGIYGLIRSMRVSILQNASYVLLILTLIVIFITNAASWKEILRYRDGYSNISPNEISAAQFLESNYKNKNALLITDPATQHILEPLSMINTQGGAYMKAPTRTQLHELITASSSATMANLLRGVQDNLEPEPDVRLFAVSGRYFLWQYSAPEDKMSLSFNIWYPSDFTLENLKTVHFLRDSENFLLVYQNPTIAIFEVKK